MPLCLSCLKFLFTFINFCSSDYQTFKRGYRFLPPYPDSTTAAVAADSDCNDCGAFLLCYEFSVLHRYYAFITACPFRLFPFQICTTAVCQLFCCPLSHDCWPGSAVSVDSDIGSGLHGGAEAVAAGL